MNGTAEALLSGLDPEQRAVATALHGPVAVVAGAGTGKTRAITHRIAYGIASGVYQPSAVLAVTFTTRAAGELRGRLRHLGANGVQARTFHSAALRQAQYFWPRVHGGDLPSVLDNRISLVAEAAHRLRVSVDTARLRDLVGEIAWAKVSNVGPEEYVRVAAQHRRSVAAVPAETVARVFERYEAAKRERGRIDFEDILLCAAALLSDHPEVAEAVRRQYRHFVVDEYQDVSPLQETLLSLWRGDRRDLCVVGDPAQTIHSFAGARSSFLTDFARRHPGATVIRLVRDYRSTPQVVQLANRVMRTADGGSLGHVTLQAQLPPGPAVEFAEQPDEATEADRVADWLARQAADGVAYRDMAVLFRIHAQSPPLEQALAERQIPYLVRGADRFYERPEVRQALLAVRQAAREADSAVVEPGEVVAQVRQILTALGWTPQPPSSAGAVRERWESLAALFAVAEDVLLRPATESRSAAGSDASPAAGSEPGAVPGLAVLAAELDRRAEAQHVPAAQGVTVGTLHSAKGLEWEAVALVGVQEGSLPFVLATSEEQIAEERRLLYVGITRARRRLHISWARTRSGGGAGRRPSRFLDGALPGRDLVGGASRRSRRSTLTARCRSCGQSLATAAERTMGRHQTCPATYDERTYELLREWRRQEAAAQSLPAFCIFTDATLVAIAEKCPKTVAELVTISGVGAAKVAKYGDHVLAIVGGATGDG